MNADLPPLAPEGRVRIDTLMNLFNGQLWAFAEFLNDSPDKIVPTWKYVDYILYAYKMELDKKYNKTKKWVKIAFPEAFGEDE